jgi:hypothetical protein
LCFGCKKYIKKALVHVEVIFGALLKKSTDPILAGNHPEIDNSEVLGSQDYCRFQTLIGILNWVVTTGRINVTFAIMSLSRFSAYLRRGHLERASKVIG